MAYRLSIGKFMRQAVGLVRAWIEDAAEVGLPIDPEQITAIELTIRVAWKDDTEKSGLYHFKRTHLFLPVAVSAWVEDKYSTPSPDELGDE